VRTGDAIAGRRTPDPATQEGQQAIQRQITDQGELIRQVLDALHARQAEPVSAEAEEAREAAVADLVEDTAEPAREAARDLAQGDLEQGFAVLEGEARAAEATAVEKWRRLGALATGVDTARARAAYEEAFRLYPSDFWTCVFLARLRRQAGDLRASREAAEAANAAASSDRERSVAGNELGDVLVQAGDLAGARERYQASLAVAERLAVANPGSAQAQRDLSVSLERLGDVLVQAGDLAGARERYQASLAVLERLAAANPGSAEAQRDVVASLWRLASLEAAGVAWKDVLAGMEAMRAAGTLFPADEPFLEQARRNAAAEAN
jgi:tetratricopeptide (TPR) repeat protein